MTDKPIPPHATYNHRYGGDPLPAAMNPGELSDAIRIKIEEMFFDHIDGNSLINMYDEREINEDYSELMSRVLGAYHSKAKHDFSLTYGTVRAELKSIISNDAVKNILTFLEFAIDNFPYISEQIKELFLQFSAPFTLLEQEGYIRFHPVSLPAEGESIRENFEQLNDHGYSGATQHLLSASTALNKSDYAGCIRESIHAVESVAKIIAGDDNATLGKALNQLESQGLEIHSALKGAFSQLYGYTSDEDGIRHALLEEHAKVDQNLAMFMFGACASFAAYLVNENRNRRSD